MWQGNNSRLKAIRRSFTIVLTPQYEWRFIYCLSFPSFLVDDTRFIFLGCWSQIKYVTGTVTKPRSSVPHYHLPINYLVKIINTHLMRFKCDWNRRKRFIQIIQSVRFCICNMYNMRGPLFSLFLLETSSGKNPPLSFHKIPLIRFLIGQHMEN